jgi:hypothetical protein
MPFIEHIFSIGSRFDIGGSHRKPDGLERQLSLHMQVRSRIMALQLAPIAAVKSTTNGAVLSKGVVQSKSSSKLKKS